MIPDPTCRGFDIRLDDLVLHCRRAGTGPRHILFIPGWTMGGEVFDRQLEHFARRADVTAFAYDPRGQGRSGKPLQGYSLAQQGQDLAALIAALGLGNVVLAGWSFGVLALLSYVRQFGCGNVGAAILIDGAPRGTGGGWAWRQAADTSRGYTIRALEDQDQLREEMVRSCLESADPAGRRWFLEMIGRTPPVIAAATNEIALHADCEADLVRLCRERPVLFVVGDDWTHIAGDWRAANAPGTEFAAFGRHMMFRDRPERFNALLDDFLLRLSPACAP